MGSMLLINTALGSFRSSLVSCLLLRMAFEGFENERLCHAIEQFKENFTEDPATTNDFRLDCLKGLLVPALQEHEDQPAARDLFLVAIHSPC